MSVERPGAVKKLSKSAKSFVFFGWERFWVILRDQGEYFRLARGIPLTRGQVNPGRPCLAPPGGSKSENSLVFVGPERFWRSGWRRLAVAWPLTGRPGLPKSCQNGQKVRIHWFL